MKWKEAYCEDGVLARRKGGKQMRVEMQHIVRGLWRQLRKGKVMRVGIYDGKGHIPALTYVGLEGP